MNAVTFFIGLSLLLASPSLGISIDNKIKIDDLIVKTDNLTNKLTKTTNDIKTQADSLQLQVNQRILTKDVIESNEAFRQAIATNLPDLVITQDELAYYMRNVLTRENLTSTPEFSDGVIGIMESNISNLIPTTYVTSSELTSAMSNVVTKDNINQNLPSIVITSTNVSTNIQLKDVVNGIVSTTLPADILTKNNIFTIKPYILEIDPSTGKINTTKMPDDILKTTNLMYKINNNLIDNLDIAKKSYVDTLNNSKTTDIDTIISRLNTITQQITALNESKDNALYRLAEIETFTSKMGLYGNKLAFGDLIYAFGGIGFSSMPFAGIKTLAPAGSRKVQLQLWDGGTTQNYRRFDNGGWWT